MSGKVLAKFVGFAVINGESVAAVQTGELFDPEAYNRNVHELTNVHAYIDALCGEVERLAASMGIKIAIRRYK